MLRRMPGGMQDLEDHLSHLQSLPIRQVAHWIAELGTGPRQQLHLSPRRQLADARSDNHCADAYRQHSEYACHAGALPQNTRRRHDGHPGPGLRPVCSEPTKYDACPRLCR